jgi:membrane carboxypeptidase/penicillin-binding protein PbpC
MEKPASAVNRLYWLECDAFLGSSDPASQLPWTPAPGRHRLNALDDHGRVGSLKVEIRRE